MWLSLPQGNGSAAFAVAALTVSSTAFTSASAGAVRQPLRQQCPGYSICLGSAGGIDGPRRLTALLRRQSGGAVFGLSTVGLTGCSFTGAAAAVRALPRRRQPAAAGTRVLPPPAHRSLPLAAHRLTEAPPTLPRPWTSRRPLFRAASPPGCAAPPALLSCRNFTVASWLTRLSPPPPLGRPQNGGALYARATAALSGSTFSNVTAGSGAGGAAFSGDFLSAATSSFSRTTASLARPGSPPPVPIPPSRTGHASWPSPRLTPPAGRCPSRAGWRGIVQRGRGGGRLVHFFEYTVPDGAGAKHRQSPARSRGF